MTKLPGFTLPQSLLWLDFWRDGDRSSETLGATFVCAEYPQVPRTTYFINDSFPFPGLVQTEFQAAMYPDSPDKVAAIHNSVPCLQSEDISGAVNYILACPPHMQVRVQLLSKQKTSFYLELIYSEQKLKKR